MLLCSELSDVTLVKLLLLSLPWNNTTPRLSKPAYARRVPRPLLLCLEFIRYAGNYFDTNLMLRYAHELAGQVLVV